MTAKGMGWLPDVPSARDWTEAEPRAAAPLLTRALPLSVAVSQSADLRAYMPPIEDQGAIGCHDESTEVLTVGGWQSWATVTMDTLLGTVEPTTKQLFFDRPLALQQYEFRGDLHRIEHQSLDYALTPNHRIWLRPWVECDRTLARAFEFRRADQIGWYSGLLAAPSGQVGVNLEKVTVGSRCWNGDDFVKLVALVLSDGWVGGTENNINTVSFCCFNPKRQDMIRAFAQHIGAGEIPGRPGVWKWSDAGLANWFRCNCYVAGMPLRAPFKRLPDLLRSAILAPAQIELFLAFYGDQHVGWVNRQFYTSSRCLADGLQDLLLRCGRRSGISTAEPRTAMIRDRLIRSKEKNHTITEWTTRELSIERKRQCYVERYQGPVYCATVLNGTLVTRRNGKVLISGNSCTAQAAVALLEYGERRWRGRHVDLSRLFVYKVSRRMIGFKGDSGAYLRTAMGALVAFGAPPEHYWPYRDDPSYDDEPDAFAYAFAQSFQALRYLRLDPNGASPVKVLENLKRWISQGYPAMFGFPVYDEFMEPASGSFIDLPKPGSREHGGHAIVACGYSDSGDATKGSLLVRNSWGTDWGMGGYAWMSYGYVLEALALDWWAVLRQEWFDAAQFGK